MHPLLDLLSLEKPSHSITTWRREVLARDNFRCVVCGSSAGVEVHHFLPVYLFPEYNLRPSNGMSLCREHHGFIHSRQFTRPKAKRKGRIPYGLMKKDGRLVDNPDEIAVIDLIFVMRYDGCGYKRIAKRLNELGLPAKLGGPWSSSSIDNILKTRRIHNEHTREPQEQKTEQHHL